MKIFRSTLTPIALTLLILVALIVGGPANRFDIAVIHTLAALRTLSPMLTQAAIILTQAGSAYATIGLGLVAALWLAHRGERRRAMLLFGAVAGARLLTDGLKWLIDRPRPSVDLHQVATSSSAFPSGHAANSMAVFMLVALIVAPARYRSAAVTSAVLLSLAIGATRPLLGVHWPSDMIGGWALGLLAAWIALWIGERSGVLPVEPQHDIVGGHVAVIDQN
ncbi:MAG: phosphatase PAP2 family protein [Sphingomicrobium sp.]